MINQSVPPDEIIIVKDGPLPEELLSVLDSFCARYPSLFTIVDNKINLGLGLSLNNGLKASRNELIARMDTDDISKKDRCEKQLNEFEKNPELTIVGAWAEEFDGETSNVLSIKRVPENSDDIYEYGKRRSPFTHPLVMFKKSAVLSVGGYANLRRNQDVDLFGRMLFAGFKAYNIQEPLLWFRTDKALSKRRKSWENTKTYISTIKSFWKMGYSSFWDYFKVALAQTIIFLLPTRVQMWIYKRFLRK